MAEPNERDALAAELAIGLLDGPERADALRLVMADPEFAAQVDAWSLRLAPMLGDVPSIAPPARTWDGIEAQVSAGGVVRRLRLWRGAALASTGIAAALALFLALGPLARAPVAPTTASIAVAQLAGEGNAAAIGVAYDPQSGLLRLAAPAAAAQSKSPELWIIPADGVPRSLGMIHPASPIIVTESLRPLMRAGGTLAVTMEDAATAPHVAPTSAPVLSGKILSI